MMYNVLFSELYQIKLIKSYNYFDQKYFKGALDKCNIILQLFSKKSWDFYTIRSVSMGNDCMPGFTF